MLLLWRKGTLCIDCSLKIKLFIGLKYIFVSNSYKWNEKCNIASIWVLKRIYSNIVGPNKAWIPKIKF